MPWGGARGQNLGHIGLFLICFFLLVFIHEIIKQKVLFRVYFLSVTLDYMIQCPRVGLGVKIEDILDFFSFYFLLYGIIQFEQQVLLGYFSL